MEGKEAYEGIGLMSGTSLDGVDLAHVRFELEQGRWKFELLKAETVPLDPKWHDRLVCLPEQSAEIFAKTHTYFGHYLGQVTAAFIKRNGLRPQFVASHGQTIFHQPDKNFTTQIGDGESMVTWLNCPLVSNFRNKDVALGGQGAPLVPFGEKHLFPEQRLFLNLGGFCNLTVGDLAWDVCAANMALNWLIKNHDPALKYDKDGEFSATGTVVEEILQALNALPYHQQNPPKSLGAEWFTSELLPIIAFPEIPVQDRMATYTRYLAIQVRKALEDHAKAGESLLVTGGGAHNPYLMGVLADELLKIEVKIEGGLDPAVIDFKEALIFAFLGLMTLRGESNVLTRVTGAKVAAPGGSIHLPPKGGFALKGF